MPTFTLRVRIDDRRGVPLPGFPLTKTLAVEEAQAFRYERKPEATYRPVPATEVESVHVLAIRPVGGAIKLWLNGQLTSNVAVGRRGLVLVFDGTICGDTPNWNLRAMNDGTALVELVGAAGGGAKEAPTPEPEA